MPRQSIHYEELMGNIEARTLLPQSPLFPDYWHLKGHYPSHTLAKGRKKQNKKNGKKGPFFSDQISAVHQSECFQNCFPGLIYTQEVLVQWKHCHHALSHKEPETQRYYF